MTDSRNKGLLSHDLASPDTRRRWVMLATLLTIMATGAVFAPAVGYDFINYDDDWFVSDNPYVLRGLTWSSIEYAFTTRDLGYPKPLAILSWMLDAEVYGSEPWGFHFTNVLLHALASGLLLLVLYISTGSLWRSLLVVGLWAVHPLRVEPVAWVTSRKDVLAAVFGFGAWLTYVKAAKDEKWGWYVGSLLLYACCLLSKPVFVTLPVLLLLWDYWPLKRFPSPWNRWRAWGRLIVEKVPYGVLAVGLAAWVLLTRPGTDGQASPLGARIINAIVSYPRYLAKLVDFSTLVIPYPHRDWSVLVWGGSAVLLVVVTALAIWRRRRMPWLLAGWAWFGFALIPMLRIKSFGDFSMADRFAYVPTIGVTLAIIWSLPTPRTKASRIVAVVLCLAVVGTLIGFSRAQLTHWQDSGTLFRHSIASTWPDPHPNAIMNLDVHYAMRKDLPGEAGRTARTRAIAFFEKVLEREPDLVPQAARYAIVLQEMGQEEKARKHVDHAYRVVRDKDLEPGMLSGLNALGKALLKLGDRERANEVYSLALEVTDETQRSVVLSTLADGLADLGRFEEARRLSRQALEIRGSDPDLLNNFANVEMKAGNYQAAAELYERALALFPNKSVFHFNYGRASRASGELETARRHLRLAVQQHPAWADAHLELGATEEALGNLERARRHYLAVIELEGRVADAYNNLGVIAAKRGDLQRAEQRFRQALQHDPDHSGANTNMAKLREMRSGT